MLRCWMFVLATALWAQQDEFPALRDNRQLGVAAGMAAPEFSLTDQRGTARSAASMMGSRGLIVVFFRSADW